MSAITTSSINVGMTLAYIPTFIFGYLGISIESVSILGIMMIIDYITGLAKVIVIDYRKLKSYKAIAGIIAKCTIFLVPIVIALCAKQMNLEVKSYIDAVITALVLAEAFSIIGNIRSIHLKKEIDEIDGVSFVLKKVSSVIEMMIK